MLFRLAGIALLNLCIGALAAAPPPLICPAGGPVGSVDLRVASRRATGDALPLRTINRLEEGDTLLYRPILHSGEERKGEVAIVLAPANKAAAQESLVILEPRPANKPQQWTVPLRVSVVAFVYGPSRLNREKVRSFLSRDDELVAQLADYAEKTAQTESLIAALSSPNSSAENVQSALRGFSSQYGLSTQLDRTAPPNQQAMLLFRTLNPAIAGYDPLSPAGGQQVAKTAGLATSVAALFFGSPVGLAAGGTAMLLQLHSVAFPRTEFRSSFSQSLAGDGLGLCGRRDPAPPHTKVAYLWATRVPNAGPPQLSIEKANFLPPAVRSPLPITASDADWRLLDRVRNWALQPETGKPVPVRIQKVGDKALELDLGKSLKPGRYALTGAWDWDPLRVNGWIDVTPLGDFASARLVALSQDLLVAKTGKVPVTLEGSDFEFVTKVEIEKVNDKFASPEPVRFVLPRGLRQGPQEKIDLQVNTIDLDPGRYKLLLTQVDGRAHPVELKILAAPPRIENLPVVLNQGVSTVEFTLKGQRLDLLDRLEVAKGRAELGPPAQSERRLRLRMATDLEAGTSLAMKAYIEDRSEPLRLSDAVRIVGPRPRIAEVRVSQPADQDVQLEQGELLGGVYLSAMLRVEHLQSNSVVRLSCEQPGAAVVTLHLGERSGAVSLQQLTPDQLFLSFDSGAWINGCLLRARVLNGSEGESDDYALGRVVRAPKIENFELTAKDAETGQVRANLTGQNLETIEKTGWSTDEADAVPGLPLPVPGEERKQVLQISLPPPPMRHAQLYVWLRGESRPRATRIHS